MSVRRSFSWSFVSPVCQIASAHAGGAGTDYGDLPRWSSPEPPERAIFSGPELGKRLAYRWTSVSTLRIPVFTLVSPMGVNIQNAAAVRFSITASRYLNLDSTIWKRDIRPRRHFLDLSSGCFPASPPHYIPLTNFLRNLSPDLRIRQALFFIISIHTSLTTMAADPPRHGRNLREAFNSAWLFP